MASRISRGKPIINLLPLEKDESINAILPVKEFTDDQFVFMVTSTGTYQKGFTPKELKDYIQKVLGKNFNVDLIKGQKIGATSIKIKKLEPKKMKAGGIVEKNKYNYNTQRTI